VIASFGEFRSGKTESLIGHNWEESVKISAENMRRQLMNEEELVAERAEQHGVMIRALEEIFDRISKSMPVD